MGISPLVLFHCPNGALDYGDGVRRLEQNDIENIKALACTPQLTPNPPGWPDLQRSLRWIRSTPSMLSPTQFDEKTISRPILPDYDSQLVLEEEFECRFSFGKNGVLVNHAVPYAYLLYDEDWGEEFLVAVCELKKAFMATSVIITNDWTPLWQQQGPFFSGKSFDECVKALEVTEPASITALGDRYCEETLREKVPMKCLSYFVVR